jgi:hypothetical protein
MTEDGLLRRPLACCLRAVKRSRAGRAHRARGGLGSIGCLLAQLLAWGARVLARPLDSRRPGARMRVVWDTDAASPRSATTEAQRHL